MPLSRASSRASSRARSRSRSRSPAPTDTNGPGRIERTGRMVLVDAGLDGVVRSLERFVRRWNSERALRSFYTNVWLVRTFSDDEFHLGFVRDLAVPVRKLLQAIVSQRGFVPSTFPDASRHVSEPVFETDLRLVRAILRAFPTTRSHRWGPDEGACLYAFFETFVRPRGWWSYLLRRFRPTMSLNVPTQLQYEYLRFTRAERDYQADSQAIVGGRSLAQRRRDHERIQAERNRVESANESSNEGTNGENGTARPRRTNRVRANLAWIDAVRETRIPNSVADENRMNLRTFNRLNRGVRLACRHWLGKADLRAMAQSGRTLACPYCRAPIRASNFETS